MSIADVLAPKQLPTIDAARVTTHTLIDDETKEDDMSLVTDITTTVAQLGGRCSNADLKLATGFDDKKLGNAIYMAKKAGQIDRDGKDYVLTKGAPAPKASKKATPAKKKPAAKAKKTAAPSAKLKQLAAHNAASAAASWVKRAIAAAPVPVADPRPEAYLLRDGGVLIVDGAARIHLTEAQYIAALNPKV